MGDIIKKILILYGGKSYEHEISIKSFNNIFKNIDNNIYNIDKIYISKDNIWYYKNKKVKNIIKTLKKYDIVFPILHGNNGEDGKIQGMLELFNIKYIGCNMTSSILCYDKLLTKIILNHYNIPQVPYTTDINKTKYPCIVKPCKSGSSIGINIANNKEELDKCINEALKYDNKYIIEKYINAKEYECAIYSNKDDIICNVGEIDKKNNFYDYNDKYINKISTIIPANINKKLENKIKKYAILAYKLLGCNTLSRIDFLYDIDNKKLYLNEINTIPGFTDTSMYPKLIGNLGYSYQELITKLIESEKD